VLIALSSIAVFEFVEGSFALLAVGGLVALAIYLPVVYPMRAMLPGRSSS
jgi:hypothetical protein